MGKPSIFNSNYHKIMRRRKIVFRTLIMIAALAVIFFTYNKSAIPNLKKFAGNLKLSQKESTSKIEQPKDVNIEDKENDKKDNVEANPQEQKEPVVESSQGEFSFKFPSDESISIIYEKKGEDVTITGIKPGDNGIAYDIRDDGKAIVFDNPKISDIWLYNVDGSSLKLNTDSYKQLKENGTYNQFDKLEIMERFNYNYVWASKPKFLKDGRIVYQSNLPWFKEINSIYLWVLNSDGSENRRFLSTGQSEPVQYTGFTEEGRLIIEFGGNKYTFDIEDGSKQRID